MAKNDFLDGFDKTEKRMFKYALWLYGVILLLNVAWWGFVIWVIIKIMEHFNII